MQLKRLCRGLLTLGISCSLMFQTPVLAAEETTTDTQTDASAVTTNSIPGWPQGPEITSSAAVIMEDATQTLLYSKNMNQVLYPGATVKIMTTLLALENCQLTDQVTMTDFNGKLMTFHAKDFNMQYNPKKPTPINRKTG